MNLLMCAVGLPWSWLSLQNEFNVQTFPLASAADFYEVNTLSLYIPVRKAEA